MVAAGTRSARQPSAKADPLAARATSRIISASSLMRGPRDTEPVVRVSFQQLGGHCAGLPVSCGRDDKPVDPLHPPAAFHELHSKPVEQLGMRRWLALGAEILARFDDATSEVLLP